MHTLLIRYTDDHQKARAAELAQALNIELNAAPTTPEYELVFSPAGVSLQVLNQGKQNPITVSFHDGSADHRRKFGGGKGQMIAKAIGVSAQVKPRILDATAGLGGDAFVLASLGCHVHMQERSPIAYSLLADGLNRARVFAQEQQDEDLLSIIARMQLLNTNSIGQPVDNREVIYLDPMFPLRKKSAAVNKSMRAFHDLIGNDEDADQLLTHALAQDVCRVVVKRPRIAPHLGNKKPSYSLEGKSSRFDIYALKKLQ